MTSNFACRAILHAFMSPSVFFQNHLYIKIYLGVKQPGVKLGPTYGWARSDSRLKDYKQKTKAANIQQIIKHVTFIVNLLIAECKLESHGY